MAAVIADYRDRVRFEPQRFTPVPLAESARTRALLVCLEPGQFIPVHEPNVDVTFVILEGSGEIVAGTGPETPVGAGAVSFIPAGEARGLRATERLVALHVVSPPPTAADHTKVTVGLQRGTWR